MPKSEKDLDTLKKALNYDWPEIQKYLIEEGAKDAVDEKGDKRDPYEPYWETNEDGTRTLHMDFDSWWLKDFKREDVIMQLPGVVIMNTKPWHTDAVAYTLRATYGLLQDEDCDGCYNADIAAADGAVIAVDGGHRRLAARQPRSGRRMALRR